MVSFFEMMMLICFGVSWPFNILRSYRSRTAKGKSILFSVCVLVGYLCGLVGKFLAGNLTYVVVFYVLDLVMVCIDLVLTVRNRALDRREEARA